MPDDPTKPTPPKPAIVLDFDRVLFDTNAYIAGLRQAATDLGISKGDWEAAYQDRGEDRLVRLPRLIKNLAGRSERRAAKLQEAFDRETAESMWYLYADARTFLEQFQDAAEVYLLTFGDPDLQNRKIDAVGIRDFFTRISVVEVAKADATDVPVPSVSQAIFINDNRKEMLDMARRYRWAKHLHINRGGEEVPADFPFPSYPDLRSAAPAIASAIGLALVTPERPATTTTETNQPAPDQPEAGEPAEAEASDTHTPDTPVAEPDPEPAPAPETTETGPDSDTDSGPSD